MSIEWVNGAIEEIRAWGRSKDVAVDIDEVRLLCDYASDYLDVAELSDFTPGTFEQLLLDIYPRKVIAPPESAAETVAAAHTLVEFLLDTGEIGAKMATRMRARIDQIAPEMPAALADTSRFGMAKSIFGAMGADADAGEAGAGPGTLASAAAHGHPGHAVRHPRGRGGVPSTRPAMITAGGECGCPECVPLPPVRLAPPQRVARAVRDAGLLHDACELVSWMIEGGRTPTVRGRLRVRDAARAARELGLPAPALAWELAVTLGLVEAAAAVRAAPGFRPLAARADDEVLDLWAATVTFLTGGPASGVTGSAHVDPEVRAVHDLLYRLRAPMTVPALRELFADPATGGDQGDEPPVGEDAGGGPSWGARPAHENETTAGAGPGAPGDFEAALGRLARCGTVELLKGVVRLTPQGVWGLREMFSRMGLTAPLAPDPAEGDAAGLIACLLGGAPAERAEQAERDIASWLGRRSPAEAARELLGAARGAQAATRGMAVAIVGRLGPEAEPSVRPFLDDPELRPHAVRWLASHDLGAPVLTSDEILWVSVDALALAVPSAEEDPDGFAENLTIVGPPAHIIEEMWRVDHPDVAEVLDLLGRHLPDRNLAKAARKAAFKARSRGIV